MADIFDDVSDVLDNIPEDKFVVRDSAKAWMDKVDPDVAEKAQGLIDIIREFGHDGTAWSDAHE